MELREVFIACCICKLYVGLAHACRMLLRAQSPEEQLSCLYHHVPVPDSGGTDRCGDNNKGKYDEKRNENAT